MHIGAVRVIEFERVVIFFTLCLLTVRMISRQGVIQGALGGMQAFAEVIGPLAFGGLFTWGNSELDFPQLPYYVGTGVLLIGIVIASHIPRRGVAEGEAAASATESDDAGLVDGVKEEEADGDSAFVSAAQSGSGQVGAYMRLGAESSPRRLTVHAGGSVQGGM
jgi:hypothetical protein